MKIGVLTSSRADFGIYLPLLKPLQSDSYFDLEIIAFGTHLSKKHGHTVKEIKSNGFEVKHQIETMADSDSAVAISQSIGKTIETFATFWNSHSFDLVLALGDRFEMFAAVTSGSPLGVTFGHIHAGETTLGAIDNAYRHSISLMSKILFVTTEDYSNRANEIIEEEQKVFNVGALSIDNLENLELYDLNEFEDKFEIDLSKPSILSTFHPETVSFENNETYIHELIKSFEIIQNDYQIIITMPNADTMGNMIREKLNAFGKNNPNVKLIESFGMLGYLSCMKHCAFLLGNTSSGFVEASFFPKYVINLGDRQKGRMQSPNILTIPITSNQIIDAVKKVENSSSLKNLHWYGIGNAAQKIVQTLKDLSI